MENQEKEKTLKQAILFQRDIKFDYVTRMMEIKFGRNLSPIEVKGKWLYGYDLDDNRNLKRFLVDGIQKLEIVYTDEKENK